MKMGLIRSTFAAANATLKDQWLEFVTLEDIDADVLVKRGTIQKSSKNKGHDEVLTNGSRIVVPEGFAMMIMDQGKIVEFSAEAGEFTYDSGSEPSVFYGKLSTTLKESMKQFGDRIRFGGDVPKETRVYYVNLREMTGNKFGTSQPIPFDDPKYQTIDIRYFGMYSMKVADPIIFVQNLIGANAKDEVRVTEFLPQLKAEFIMSLTSAMAKLAYEKQISFNRLPIFQEELGTYMNDSMDDALRSSRGLEIIQVALESISVDDETKEKIKEYDKVYFAQTHGSGMMTAASADAMRMAATNEGGNAGMFMGMGVGGMMSGAMQAGSQMAYQSHQETDYTNIVATPEPKPKATWVCACGIENTGNFCGNCGTKKPEVAWTCACGAKNTGNFCANCGKKRL